MTPPSVTLAQARDAVRFVSAALADGFSTKNNPSAIEEGWRRYCRARGDGLSRISFRARISRAAELYQLQPSAKAGARLGPPYRLKKSDRVEVTADLATLADDLHFWLRKRHGAGPKTIPDLSARLRVSIPHVKAAIDMLRDRGVNIQQINDRYDIPQHPPAARTTKEAPLELLSRPDHTFLLSAIGDLHAASKHCRWDVRADLIKRAEDKGVQAIFDTGNWIDGEKPFNRYDLEVVGLDPQLQLLAREHPKTSLPIYAVSGDDHEGWYAQSEGINIGRYAETIMRDAGHNWNDLGYQEANVTLRNADSGKAATLTVVHPGGGSAYALSYAIQKIIESLEGGEKPHVGFYGHYHKLWFGNIRNVWCVQTGCAQDQTSFMRKKRSEAHVGGFPWIELEQDPRTGAIIGMTPKLVRYFNSGYYAESDKDNFNRWSHHGPIRKMARSI